MSDDAHYFIGIPIQEEYREWLVKWQETLKSFVDYRKWVHQNDFHITLRFLGGVPPEKLDRIKEELDSIKGTPLHLKVNGLNFFGKEDQPRVMYAEIERDEKILEFKTEIDEHLSALDIEREKRPYRPHITLAKKWAKGKLHLSKEALEHKIEGQKIFNLDVHQFNLYRVHPDREQKYHIIESYDLK
ncbi:RNA 2',3'-cyclic phosphodiesterase [Piscibacillus halophilus]|uniref:RNA 2',3'-cyclic phosphodiesterase n=1 Tax=Piscibacillus halophilus TaxID=571933 RepID=A0A1H9FFC2_9BACI|nr:RNA 2',3'-cyclic phosphodiesterase [Piscibacillus halophilus]SEQ36617.1 2'-5' RNA ligase [Piscibacillus halophilus]